jgi:hypothetical protein
LGVTVIPVIPPVEGELYVAVTLTFAFNVTLQTSPLAVVAHPLQVANELPFAVAGAVSATLVPAL